MLTSAPVTMGGDPPNPPAQPVTTGGPPKPRGPRRPIAVRTAGYAVATLVVVTAIQVSLLRPLQASEVLVLLLPLVVCPVVTFMVARAIVGFRVKILTDVYLRFPRGEVDDDVALRADPEFREAFELFVRMARELHGARRALEERDVERRRLFSDVVHELGTPVSSLLGLAEAFERPELSATAAQRERLTRAVAGESDRLARFVDDLRELAQLDDPQMTLQQEDIALDELARDVADRLNAIPSATSVTVSLDPARVRGDATRLEQIVVNLVSNARRYALPPAPIHLTVSATAARVSLAVDDGGPGVPETELSKLGQRLRRLDSSRTRSTGGTGLGLSIVTAIASKHGGRVRYGRSSLGGLRVEVELPAS